MHEHTIYQLWKMSLVSYLLKALEVEIFFWIFWVFIAFNCFMIYCLGTLHKTSFKVTSFVFKMFHFDILF